jgi:hypothetical protein
MIFSNNIWITPWEIDDIYSDVLNKINELEIKNYKSNDDDDSDRDSDNDMMI